MFVMSTVIITGSTTLRVLNVGWNQINDDGISMISEELQHNNSLTELRVELCGLSAKGSNLDSVHVASSVNLVVLLWLIY